MQLYNLWYLGELVLERVPWKRINDEIGVLALHKDDVVIEMVDRDVQVDTEETSAKEMPKET